MKYRIINLERLEELRQDLIKFGLSDKLKELDENMEYIILSKDQTKEKFSGLVWEGFGKRWDIIDDSWDKDKRNK